MSLETSRGFTYRWRVGEREEGVTQALVEQELTSSTNEEEEEASEISVRRPLGVAGIARTVTALPYGRPDEPQAGRRASSSVHDSVAYAL